jgi:cell division septum initiation protein DivIVA
MASYIIEDSQGRPFDLFGNTKGSAGSTEGAPVARDPRAKGPDEVVNDPVSGLIKQASWGLSAGLFALPDLAVKGIGKGLGMDDKNVMTLTKMFNRGETAPRNEQERYARAIAEGIGGGLLPTGVLSFIARGRAIAPIAAPSAGVFKQIANETLDFVKKNPKQAFTMDAAFGAAHETLRQAVEENMSDDDPERKAFFKDFMPTAALIGVPLAVSALSPTAIAYRFGKKKMGDVNASLGDLEKDALKDLNSVIPIAPKVFAARASQNLRESLGASVDSPEGRAALAKMDEIFNDYPQLAAAGFKLNIVEQTMDPMLIDRAEKAILSLPAGSEAQKLLRAQRTKNDAAFASLYDNLTPQANMELQTALSQVQQQRQQLFDSLAANRTDVTQDELTRLSLFYGPLNPDKLNGELRGMLQAQTELDVGMRKNIMRKLGLSQGVDKNGLPLPVRNEKGQSLLTASNIEQPAVDLLGYYDTLLKGRTTMATEMRRFITGSEPLNTLRKNVTAKIKARDDLEAKMNEDLLVEKYMEALQGTKLAENMNGPLAKEFAAQDNKTIQDVLKNLRLILKPNPTEKELGDIKALGRSAQYNPNTGDVRLSMGRDDTLTMNVKTIGQDAKQIAEQTHAVDINIPEAIDYLEAAARFRNQALDKHNSVLAGSRQTRVVDADQYLALGNKVYDDFESMILNNVPRLKQERDAMKTVLDDYRSVYEQRLPLLLGRRSNEGGATRYSVPNEQVLSVAFKSAEDVRTLSALIGNNPIGLNLLEKGTLNWLQSKNILDKDGLISPKKINDVLQKNQNIVSVLPKQVQDTLKNEADTAVNVSRRLGEIKQQEVIAQDVEFDNFLTKVLRPGTDNEIVLKQALSSPIEMSKLVSAVKGDPDKLAALRRAVFDISKEGALTGGSLKKFIEVTEKSLKVLFDEKHLKDLAALADIQARNATLARVTGVAPKFESTSQIFQRMLGVSIPGLMTYGRDVAGGRISPQGAGISLGVRLFSSMEEELQNKMMVRALTDPKVASALANAKTADQGKLLLREIQSTGYLSRALMADVGVTSSQLAMGDRETPVEGMSGTSAGVTPTPQAATQGAPRPETAAALLKKMPPAPQTRGMPPAALSPRFAPPPAPASAPAAPGMYQMLFPDDPISKMLNQRQQPVAPPQ